MKMKTRLVLILGVIFCMVLAACWWWRKKSVPPVTFAEPTASAAPSVPGSVTAGIPPASAPAGGPATAANTGSMSPVDPEFQKWFENEAQDVDRPHVDSAEKRRELARVVSQLTPAQARHLLRTALAPAARAGEKILAVYLLGEGGAKTRGELSALIASPLPDRGPRLAHSEAEVQGAADRARALMAIDALAAQAQRDPTALNVLAQTIDRIQDSYVRGHAEQRLRELRGH
jgi:hypothetical protein